MLMAKTRPAIAALVALAALAAHPARAADKLKIGFVATLTGSAGLLGQNLRDGFMLGIEEAGGKLGGLPTEISIDDAQFKPDVAKEIAEKLVRRDKVDIVTGIVYSNIMMAIYNTVVDAKTILISQNAGPSPIAGKLCSPYFFSTSWQNDQPHAAVGQYVENLGVKRVFLIASNYRAGQDALAGFKSKFKGAIVNEIYPALGQPDYSAEITQIAAAKSDAVYAFIASGAAISFVKQYAEAGLMKQIPLYSDFVINATTLPAIGDVALGARSAAFWTIDMDNPASRHFVAAFRKKYNYVPGVYSAQAYDAARLIDAAVREIGGKVEDRQALITALAEAHYESVRGPYRYNNNHFPIQNFYATEIVRDKDGTLVEVSRGIILKDDADAYHQECPLK
jgi:branched-chain amino acid transport system substrate-binding protein